MSAQVGLAGWEEDASLMLMPMLFTWHLIGHMVLLYFSNLLCVCMVICNVNAFALQHITCTRVLL